MSNSPISTTGHSARPAFSASSASSSISSSLALLASSAACSLISSVRSAALSIDGVGGELVGVVLEARDREFVVAVEAVAARGGAAFDARDLERHDLAVERADDGLQRTDPLEGVRAPAHGLGPGEFRQHARHDVGGDVGCRAAGLVDAGDVVIALLVVLDDFRVGERSEAGSFQKALHGLLGRADARTLAFLGHARRLLGHILDRQRQAARGREGVRLANVRPCAFRPSVTRRFRSSAARTCMRDGISSENSSSRSSAMTVQLCCFATGPDGGMRRPGPSLVRVQEPELVPGRPVQVRRAASRAQRVLLRVPRQEALPELEQAQLLQVRQQAAPRVRPVQAQLPERRPARARRREWERVSAACRRIRSPSCRRRPPCPWCRGSQGLRRWRQGTSTKSASSGQEQYRQSEPPAQPALQILE